MTALRIGVIGVGAVGSSFAFQLARAGHDVTVVARGRRLAQLQHDRAIVTSVGERVPVDAREALDPTVAFDLVLVTVLASQVDALLPVLGASAARTVMFMFNHFGPLQTDQYVVGAKEYEDDFAKYLQQRSGGDTKATKPDFGKVGVVMQDTSTLVVKLKHP